MPSAGVASKAAPATIASGDGDDPPARRGPSGSSIPRPGADEHVVPVGDDRRNGKDPLERIRNVQLYVCHRTASWYERRSAACAVASVAETVPTSTSSATAIDW